MRGGAAMFLLWNGLADYVLERGIEVMFGAASFPRKTAAELAKPLSYLHHFHRAPVGLRVFARPEHRMEMNILPQGQVSRDEAMAGIPALIKAYLRLGRACQRRGLDRSRPSTPSTSVWSWTPPG